MKTNSYILKLAVSLVLVLTALFCLHQYSQYKLKERVIAASKFLESQTHNPLLDLPSRDIELSDRQVKDLVDLYIGNISPNGGDYVINSDGKTFRRTKLWGDSIRINFDSVCSLKLKEATINKYKEEYVVLLDKIPDDWPCHRAPADPQWLRLDFRGIDENTLIVRFSTSVAFSSDALFRWNETAWEMEHLSTTAGTWLDCPDQKNK